jgi:hypothetical protein
MSLIVPEGMRQKTAEMFFEDFWLFDQPWDFQLEEISPALQAAIHIWHGTGDRQVCRPRFDRGTCAFSFLVSSPRCPVP